MTTSTFQAVTTPPAAPARLNEASDPKTTLQYLRGVVGLTPGEIAKAIGTEDRSIRRWMKPDDTSKMQVRNAERLDDLRSLVVLLADTLPGEQTGNWLRARNRLLERERPLELLCTPKDDGYAQQYKRVERAALRFVDGDPI